MDEFIQMIKQLIWYLIITGIFIFYLTYHQSLDQLTLAILLTMTFIAIFGGGGLSALRYFRAQKREPQEREKESEARCLAWSPLGELQYDFMGCLTFILIIGIGIISSPKLNAADLGQAILAFAAFLFGKRFFIRKIRKESGEILKQ